MVPPHELKSVEFTKGIRGYSPQEVDAHIEYLRSEYEGLFKKITELERENSLLKEKYREAVIEKEAAMGDSARVAGEQLIAEAEEKAEMIIRATKTNCDFIINDYKRIVSEEREKLVHVQAHIQAFKEKMLNQCREYMDTIDDFTELAYGSSLYYANDEELVSRAIDEIKTDVRYAMAEKEQLDNITEDEIAVDLDYFNEEPIGDEPDMSSATRTGVFVPEKTADMEKTITIPDTKHSKIGDRYMEFLEELDRENKSK